MTEHHVTVTLTVKEFSAVSGVVATFGLLHPHSGTAQTAVAARESMCQQVGIDPVEGVRVADDALNTSKSVRLFRWLGR